MLRCYVNVQGLGMGKLGFYHSEEMILFFLGTVPWDNTSLCSSFEKLKLLYLVMQNTVEASSMSL